MCVPTEPCSPHCTIPTAGSSSSMCLRKWLTALLITWTLPRTIMPEEPIDGAIERARTALSLGREIPGSAAHVARIDRPGTGYYLVRFGAENATLAVAAVDAASGEVLSYAKLPGSGPHLAVTAEEATRRAGAKPIGTPHLVWRPCRASFSMLFPLWEIPTAMGSVYVDQQRRLWTVLEPGGPGG